MVLPRLWDLAASVIDLWGMTKLRAWDFAGEVLISDFTDAFLTLKLYQKEMGYFATRAHDDEWFVYCRAPFGLTSAPPLWCRFTALVGRLTQAMLKPNEGRHWHDSLTLPSTTLEVGQLASYWCWVWHGVSCPPVASSIPVTLRSMSVSALQRQASERRIGSTRGQ